MLFFFGQFFLRYKTCRWTIFK